MDALVEDDFDEPSERDLVLMKRGKEVGRLRVVKAVVLTAKQIEEEEEEYDRLAKEAAEEDDPALVRLSSVASSIATPTSQSTQASFQDYYMKNGCEIDFCVAVDFTSSNGDPRTTESLHYILDDESNNDYQEVIQEVGNAIIQYSSNKECCIWGFGANTKHLPMWCQADRQGCRRYSRIVSIHV